MLINYSFFNKLRRGIHYLTDLNSDIASEEETILQIRKGSSFRGANFWLLVFAILIASIGLNVNSPAVVIGAMLISPLMGPIMGPIMGIGLGMGILVFS
jgi:uncharacterized membrane protein